MDKLILITFFAWISAISCKAEKEVVFDEQKLQSWCSRNGVRRHYYIIPQNYQFAKAFCRATGGRLYEPKCKASNDRLSQLTKKHSPMVSFLLCIIDYTTLPDFRACAQFNALEKCVKICHILYV